MRGFGRALDADVIGMLGKATEKAEQEFRAMVIANQGEHFSVGANLFLVAMAGSSKNFDALLAEYDDEKLWYSMAEMIVRSQLLATD